MSSTNLADLLRGDGIGFAVRRGGVINVDTVHCDPGFSMIAALFKAGYMVSCEDPNCDWVAQFFKSRLPDAELIEVRVSEVVGD